MKTYPKATFLPKIKDWSYSLKMAKLLFFILSYIYLYVMSKLTQDLIPCLKYYKHLQKLFKNVKN